MDIDGCCTVACTSTMKALTFSGLGSVFLLTEVSYVHLSEHGKYNYTLKLLFYLNIL